MIYNLCFLYTNSNSFKIIGLQTNNILILANNIFTDTEKKKLIFRTKDKETFTVDYLIKFNRGLIIFNNKKKIFFN